MPSPIESDLIDVRWLLDGQPSAPIQPHQDFRASWLRPVTWLGVFGRYPAEGHEARGNLSQLELDRGMHGVNHWRSASVR